MCRHLFSDLRCTSRSSTRWIRVSSLALEAKASVGVMSSVRQMPPTRHKQWQCRGAMLGLQTCQLSRIFHESHEFEIVLPLMVSLLRPWNSWELAIVNSGRWLAIKMGLRLPLYRLGTRPYHFLSCVYKLYLCTCRLNVSKPSTCMRLGLDWWSLRDGRSVHWRPSRWGYFFIEYSDTHV